MKKSVISALLAVVMLCTLFSGCGNSDVIKVGDRTFDEETYCAALVYADMQLSQQYGAPVSDNLDGDIDGKKGIDLLKEQAEDLLVQMEASRKLAADNGITLTDEDKKMLEDQKNADSENMGGRKVFIEDLTLQGLNEAFYDYVMESSIIYSKYIQGFDVPTEEIITIATELGYVRVKHVLIEATAGAPDFESKKALAAEIAARAAAGEDFEALIKEYGSDPGMESMPYGYIIDSEGYTTDHQSQMMQEFTDGSLALEVGEVSAPVQTSYGFHIIKRYPIDAASIDDETPVMLGAEGSEPMKAGDLIKYEFMDIALGVRLMEAESAIAVEKLGGYEDLDIYKFFSNLKEKQAGATHEGHNH